METVLEKSTCPSCGQSTKSKDNIEGLEFDPNRRRIKVNGTTRCLTSREWALLTYLVDRIDTVVPREQILKDVWEYEYGGLTRTLDCHIGYLRTKLDDDVRSPRYITTVRGKGYCFNS